MANRWDLFVRNRYPKSVADRSSLNPGFAVMKILHDDMIRAKSDPPIKAFKSRPTNTNIDSTRCRTNRLKPDSVDVLALQSVSTLVCPSDVTLNLSGWVVKVSDLGSVDTA